MVLSHHQEVTYEVLVPVRSDLPAPAAGLYEYEDRLLAEAVADLVGGIVLTIIQPQLVGVAS